MAVAFENKRIVTVNPTLEATGKAIWLVGDMIFY